jgi:RND family efflux transporter MFP subunit
MKKQSDNSIRNNEQEIFFMSLSKKKITLTVIIIVIVAAIIGLLFFNKAQNAAKAKNTAVFTSFPVKTAEVKMQHISAAVTMVGTMYPNNEVAVVSETAGKITAVHANIGDRLGAGGVIAVVDDEVRKATLANAEASYEKAKKDLERYQELSKEKSVNDSQLESSRLAYKAAESQYIIAKRQMNDTRIKTPIAGVVSARSIDIGTYVTSGMTVANVVDISTLKVRVNVSEKDVFMLHIGDAVEIQTDVYASVHFPGKIKSISSRGDDAHTYPVEITMQNSVDHPLKGGMFARVLFNHKMERDVIVIPREALVGSMREPEVYVVENGMARLRAIVLGRDAGTVLEVTQGISVGDRVITSGQINLQDKIPVKQIGGSDETPAR